MTHRYTVSTKGLREKRANLEDEQLAKDLNARARWYKASGTMLISGVALLALSAGLAHKSDLIGASVAAVGILLILAGLSPKQTEKLTALSQAFVAQIVAHLVRGMLRGT